MAYRIADCTGVLLAGGRASRLGGMAKGLLRLDGEPIAARALAVLGEVFEASLVVSGDLPAYAPLATVIPDAIPDKGAPGGVHAALAAARTGWIFAAGCDMPFLSAEAIRFLWERRGAAPAAGVLWRGRFQGLFAFWSRACLPRVEKLLRDGDPSLWRLAEEVGARFLEEEAWRAVDPAGRVFENVNTPEDAGRLGVSPPADHPAPG